jgi:hypothetical protein
MRTNSTEYIPNNQKVENARESREIFSRLSCFHNSTEQQIPRPVDRERKKNFYSDKKERHTVKNQLTVNKDGIFFTKSAIKKEEDMIMIFTRITLLSFQNKLLM